MTPCSVSSAPLVIEIYSHSTISIVKAPQLFPAESHLCRVTWGYAAVLDCLVNGLLDNSERVYR